MPSFSISTIVLTVTVVLLLASPAHAFGAGNIASIAKIEGLNWRHGDIEDTLLNLVMSRAAGGKKFGKMDVARVYFGNWLRDYSQAIDVGTVKYVSAEAIRILLWVLGFMTFGYGTKEFEVTAERLGCYRPEDHIDNPKDYADGIDATQYDTRLRGPVNERVELAIDPRTGMKNYIANEQAGIMTSALHVRKLFNRSIQLGRSFARSGNKAELYEALRLLGTGLHCLEDFSAHSNYTELALIEMGERDVFPHVGRRTAIRLQGARTEVFPIVTGTFGGVDFLHSVMGEFSDKATQSEISELEGTMANGGQGDTSLLKDLLSSIPSGIFGGKDEAGKADELQANATAAQMSQVRVSPRQPEEFTIQMQQAAKEIYPIIQWHDEIMLSITETIEQIPILPELISQLEEQVNIFVFSLLAPFVLPIIGQIKTELNTGSSEIIASSKDKQLIVFNDDHSTDPTHSMLSKDHFSNILNEPAGQIASQVLKWVVPQLMQCWDDERVDPDRTVNRIISGVFHHPAQRNLGEDGAVDGRRLMFGIVERWWQGQNPREQDELRRQLSREGVENGENHKPGVQDSGHGCGKPLGMAKNVNTSSNSPAGQLMGGLTQVLGGASGGSGGSGGLGSFAGEAVGGGALGGIVGSLLGGVLGDDDSETRAYSQQGRTQGGGYQQAYTEVGHGGGQYGQAQYSQTQYPGGRTQETYQQYQQPSSGYGGSGFEQRTVTQPISGGGYEQRNERTYQQGGEIQTESWREERRGSNESGHRKHHRKHHSGSDNEEYGGSREEGGRGGFEGGYGGRGGGEGGYGGREQQYGERREESYGSGRGGFEGGREEGYGSRGGGYGGQEYGRGGFEGGREEGYGARGGGFGGQEYGRQEGYAGGRGFEEEPRREERGWGGGRREEEEEERREEYQEERREDREEESGGGWFS